MTRQDGNIIVWGMFYDPRQDIYNGFRLASFGGSEPDAMRFAWRLCHCEVSANRAIVLARKFNIRERYRCSEGKGLERIGKVDCEQSTRRKRPPKRRKKWK